MSLARSPIAVLATPDASLVDATNPLPVQLVGQGEGASLATEQTSEDIAASLSSVLTDLQSLASSLTTAVSLLQRLRPAGPAAQAQASPVVLASDHPNVKVDIASSSGALAVTDGGGANSLTVDSPQLPASLGQKAATASVSVTVASDDALIKQIADRTPQLGQQAIAASTPVVLATSHPNVPVLAAQLPSTLGAKNAAGSVSVVLATDAGALSTVTRAGAKGATTAADVTSTAEGADHQALDVQLYHGGAAVSPALDASVLAVRDRLPVSVGQKAMAASLSVVLPSDGTHALDASVLAVRDRLPASIGQKTGANSFPVVIASDQTLSVTATVSGVATDSVLQAVRDRLPASVGQKASAASLPVVIASDDAVLTGGSQKSIVRGAAKGATAAADVTTTTEGADHTALDVQLYHNGAAVSPMAAGQLPSSLGQKTGANSLGVVIASDQTLAQLPASLGQKAATASLPVVLASDSAHALDTSVLAVRDRLPASLGQKTAAASVSVTVASDDALLARTPALGQQAIASSRSVVLATSHGNVPVSVQNSTIAVTDNSGSLTVDTGQLPSTLGQKNGAGSMSVVIASDGNGALGVSGTVAVSSISNSVPIHDNNGSITIDGSVGISGTPSFNIAGSSVNVPVSIQNSSLTVGGSITAYPPGFGSASVTRIAAATGSQTMLNANGSRRQATFVNESTATCYLKFGASASSTSYTIMMPGGTTYELQGNPIYYGQVSAAWSSATGAMQITEVT